MEKLPSSGGVRREGPPKGSAKISSPLIKIIIMIAIMIIAIIIATAIIVNIYGESKSLPSTGGGRLEGMVVTGGNMTGRNMTGRNMTGGNMTGVDQTNPLGSLGEALPLTCGVRTENPN